MRYVKGDLIRMAKEGQFDVIVHGCNCFQTMGAGIARQVAEAFPEALAADKETVWGHRDKLGSCSRAIITRGLTQFVIVNGYTQFRYGRCGIKVRGFAVKAIMASVKKLYSGRRIAYPKIGCGLGGGEWEEISEIIDEELVGEDHVCVVLC